MEEQGMGLRTSMPCPGMPLSLHLHMLPSPEALKKKQHQQALPLGFYEGFII